MRKAIGVAALTAALVIGGSAAPALAQGTTDNAVTEAGNWVVTPRVGLAFGGDLEGPGLGVGVAAGYNWTSRLRLLGEFALLPSVEQGVLLNIDTTVWTLTGNVMYSFATEGNWSPYVVGGLGIGRGSTDLDDVDPLLDAFDLDESDTQFVFDFGGGVHRHLNDRTSFQADLRYSTGDELVSDFLRLFAGVSFAIGEY